MTEPENSDAVPDEPDLGASVQLESSEMLDGEPGTDGLDAGYVAPDRPFGLDDLATTPDGQQAGDTLDERLAREIPDDTATLDGAAAGDGPDQTAGEIGPQAGQRRSGRLTADAVNPDSAPTDVLDADDAGFSGGAASAEEAAMHDIDENEITELGDTAGALDVEPGAADDAADAVLTGPEVRLPGERVDPGTGGDDRV